MSFGKMTDFIDIIETVNIKNAEGFSSSTDNIVYSTRAYFEEQRGTKVWANRAAFTTATCLFAFRADPSFTVTPSHFIKHNGVKYKILSVRTTQGRGMYVEVLAERIAAAKGG